jgi:SAM-dependent methyltransferase
MSMSSSTAATSRWDAAGYDRHFGSVSQLGSGVVDLLEPRPGERVLDLGCGTGELLERIVAGGAVGIGLDADTGMVGRARLRLPGVEIILADAHAFTLSEQVDAVFSEAALHRMTRPDEVASCVAAALKPGGRFVAELGGAGNVATIIAAVRTAVAECRPDLTVAVPWYFPTVGQQSAVLERAGLRVARMEHFPRRTPLSEQSDGAADWVRRFGTTLLLGLSAEEREVVLSRVTALTAADLLTEDGWVADDWRLRFVAVKPS